MALDLHHGTTYWHQTQKDIEYPQLSKDESTEIVIIGAGMSGALIAYELLKEQHNIILIDKDIPGHGSSDGNTGLIQYNSDESLHDMIKTHGEHKAVDFYRLSMTGINLLHQIADELTEDTGYAKRDSLYLSAKQSDIGKLKEYGETLNKYGFPAEWLSRQTLAKIYGLDAHGALKTAHDLELNPFKWIQALHRSNLKRGAKIFKNTAAVDIRRSGLNTYVVLTDTPYTVRAKYVIFASGYEENMIPEIEPFVERNNTFSFVSSKCSGFWTDRAMIWDSADPYLYFRSTEDDRIIAGGRDKEGIELDSEKKIKAESMKILAKIKSYYPALEAEPYKMWQSVFAESKDGLPFIGKRKNKRNQFYALGYGGNGTCYAAIAAILLRFYLRGEEHPYAYTVNLEGREAKET